MIVPRNVIRHELIGLDVLVVHASNPTYWVSRDRS